MKFFCAIMLRVFVIACGLCVLACTGGEKKGADEKAENMVGDTAAVGSDELQLVEDMPLPKTADELFDDFFFNFIEDEEFRLSRINFPVPAEGMGGNSNVGKKEWKKLDIFSSLEYSTVLYDKNNEMTILKDTSLNKVTVERIDLKEDDIHLYRFSREEGKWKLSRVELKDMEYSKCHEFLDFYKKFAADSSFQMQHISFPVDFIIEGDGEAEYLEEEDRMLSDDEWLAMIKELPFPVDEIVNIDYGQHTESPTRKIMLVRGFANSQFVRYDFMNVKKQGWKLCSVEL